MKIALLLLGFMLYPGFVSAQTIGLEEVRTLALANSRSLAKYNLAIIGTVLDERSRIFSALPSLSLGANASMSLWNAQNAVPVDNPFDTINSGANFGVSQKIFEGGKTLIQKAINEIASESARKDAQAEYFNVVDSADNSYYAVLEAMAVLEAEESSLQTALLSVFTYAGSVLHSSLSLVYFERHFEYVMERYRLSQSSITDLNEASTLLINSRNSLINARYGFLQSLSKLRSLGAFSDEEELISVCPQSRLLCGQTLHFLA